MRIVFADVDGDGDHDLLAFGVTGVFLYESLLGVDDRGDVNGDQFVNADDLVLLLAQWGGAGAADLNRDGIVSGADLSLLLSQWR